MYIPIGFEQLWSEEKLKNLRRFKPRRYKVQLNGQQFIYYIGSVDRACKFQEGRACTIWDSDRLEQNRPMGCHFYPMTWYWDEGAVIFTKHCDPFLCTAESIKYTEEDYRLDLRTFEKLAKEIETVGWTVNYAPIDALKEQHYLTI
jgi:Fe-S-cluster containining protein